VRFLAVPAIKSTMSFVEIATHLGLGFIEEVYSAAMGFFSGFQLIEVIRPLLHHQPAFRQELRSIVGASVWVKHIVGQLSTSSRMVCATALKPCPLISSLPIPRYMTNMGTAGDALTRGLAYAFSPNVKSKGLYPFLYPRSFKIGHNWACMDSDSQKRWRV
jgi:hypothetical protein